jgi:hypothetical protein
MSHVSRTIVFSQDADSAAVLKTQLSIIAGVVLLANRYLREWNLYSREERFFVGLRSFTSTILTSHLSKMSTFFGRKRLATRQQLNVNHCQERTDFTSCGDRFLLNAAIEMNLAQH